MVLGILKAQGVAAEERLVVTQIVPQLLVA
jgi:hypothetical protein